MTIIFPGNFRYRLSTKWLLWIYFKAIFKDSDRCDLLIDKIPLVQKAHNALQAKKTIYLEKIEDPSIKNLVEARLTLPYQKNTHDYTSLNQTEKDAQDYYIGLLKNELEETTIPALYDETLLAFDGDEAKALAFLEMAHQGIFAL